MSNLDNFEWKIRQENQAVMNITHAFEKQMEQDNKKINLMLGGMAVFLAVMIGGSYHLVKTAIQQKPQAISKNTETDAVYSNISNMYLVEKISETGEHELCISDGTTNIINGEDMQITLAGNIPFSLDEDIYMVENLSNYISNYDIIQEQYNLDDIKKLLSFIEQNYQYHKEKVIVLKYNR